MDRSLRDCRWPHLRSNTGKPRNRNDRFFSIGENGGSVSAVQGQRVPGGFILITGQDGVRYALRPNQVAVAHDADECQDETILRIYGGHLVSVPCSLEEVLGWFG